MRNQSDGEDEPETEQSQLDVVEVSAHSVVGLTTPHTMKLRGTIQDCSVVVLIDSGATHNFISLRLLAPLALSVTGRRSTGVVIGNGKTELSYGLCKGVKLRLPGLRVVDDFYPFELGSTNVILGMKWLRQLGSMQVNCKTLTMVFHQRGEQITLRGEPGLRRFAETLHALAQALPNISEGYMVVAANMSATTLPKSQIHPDLDGLLDQYVDLFSMPPRLPPSRDHEHRITLCDCTATKKMYLWSTPGGVFGAYRDQRRHTSRPL